jgi:hypothetical protein
MIIIINNYIRPGRHAAGDNFLKDDGKPPSGKKRDLKPWRQFQGRIGTINNAIVNKVAKMSLS